MTDVVALKMVSRIRDLLELSRKYVKAIGEFSCQCDASKGPLNYWSYWNTYLELDLSIQRMTKSSQENTDLTCPENFSWQVRLVRELEKKFSGRPVVFVAQRRILPKPKRNQRTRQKQLRPRR